MCSSDLEKEEKKGVLRILKYDLNFISSTSSNAQVHHCWILKIQIAVTVFEIECEFDLLSK